MSRMSRRSAFTLVEILIVVVILAILAAAVIPQFTDSSNDAKNSTSLFNLQTLRGQIAVYKAQHGGLVRPEPMRRRSLPCSWQKSDANGTSNPTTGTLGPYLQVIPNNPATVTPANQNLLKVVTADPTANDRVSAGSTTRPMATSSALPIIPSRRLIGFEGGCQLPA